MPAVFQKTVEQDLHKPLKIQYCADTVFTKDNAGNQINVLLFEDGEPYSSGGTVSATAIRADGATESWAGTISGNTVSVALTRAALDVPGTLQVFIKVTAGTTETTVYAGVYNVVCTETPTVVAPVTPSDVAALIASIEAAIRNIPADWTSFLGTIAPTFDPSKEGGYAAGAYVWYPGQPGNVGTLYRFTSAHSGTWTGTDVVTVVIGNELNDTVRYTQQVKTDAEKTIARANIGAADADDVVDLELTTVQVTPQTFDDNSKSQARSNIGAASSGDLSALSTTVNNQGVYIGNISASIGTVPTGKTVEGQITDLKSALNDAPSDVLEYAHPTTPFVFAGITATKVSDSTFSFEGTITASSFLSFYKDINAIPAWLEKGKPYVLVVKGATEDSKIYFEVLGFENGSTQKSFTGRRYNDCVYQFTIPESFVGGVLVRAGWLGENSGSVVNETIEYHIYSLFNEDVLLLNNLYHYLPNYTYESCDDVETGTVLFVSSAAGVKKIPDFPYNNPGTLITIGDPKWKLQYAVNWNTANIEYKFRSYTTNGWSSWTEHMEPDDNDVRYLPNYTYESCDDITEQSILFVSSAAGVKKIPDAPFVGFLQTIFVNNRVAFQIIYPWKTADHMKYRIRNSDGWTSWLEIGNGSTTNVTQNITRDTYNNTININTSPAITTDSNGWLQPVDTNTSDETGKTDMSGPILSMLNSTGYCHLAPGIYYVSGNIDMPADSMLEGCGKQTIIRLLQSVNSGYIVRMHTRSTIKNVCFSGGYSAGSIADGNIGGKKGINYIGNRDGQDTSVTPKTCTLCQIEGCWFENLDSGFYGYNAGGGLQEGVAVSNCYFTRCKAGINIDYWTEYSKFTNCVTFQCYYGCINNGGNNCFMNCTFHAVIGFLIDNSAGDKSNCAHGSVIGCTFNHIDNMNNPSQLGKGVGIKVIGAGAGFLFANCQIWYGRIHIESSSGIQITGCEIGGIGGSEYPLLELSGTTPVFIDNCLFQSMPTNSISCPVKFSNCWTYAGVEVAS